MIFGNNPKDSMNRIGKTSFFGDGSATVHIGGRMFSESGATTQMGNTMFSPGGVTQKISNSYFTPKGTFYRSGSTLFGPNGKSWYGVASDSDCMTIIDHEVNGG